MTEYVVSVDWGAIRQAIAGVEAHRHASHVGADTDVFYRWTMDDGVPAYEREGLPGLVRVVHVAYRLVSEACAAMIRARGELEDASVPQASDRGSWYWVGAGQERCCTSHRGASRMVTRRGGRAEFRSAAPAQRRQRVLARLRATIRTIIALHELRALLAATGLMRYDPRHDMGGIYDGRIAICAAAMRGVPRYRVQPCNLDGVDPDSLIPTLDEALAAFAQ